MTPNTLGKIPANAAVPQIRAGSVALTKTELSKVVVFSLPMTDADYVVVLEPATVAADVGMKTATGFLITGHGVGGTYRWLAVHFI